MRKTALLILLALLLLSCQTKEAAHVTPAAESQIEETAAESPSEPLPDETDQAPPERDVPPDRDAPPERDVPPDREAPPERTAPPETEESETLTPSGEQPEAEEETIAQTENREAAQAIDQTEAEAQDEEPLAEEPPVIEEESEAAQEEPETVIDEAELIALLLSFMPEEEEESDTITFSGGTSSVVMREGKENVKLTEGALVSIGSMTISADEIELSGNSWRFVQCDGGVKVLDEERGISITTSSLWYDREEERLLISAWYELEDRTNEVSASGAVLEYRMEEEQLQLDKDVLLLKATEDGLMRCRAQSVQFSRSDNQLTLRGSSTVNWKGNSYAAEVISVDLDTDTIVLEGRIQGDIHG